MASENAQPVAELIPTIGITAVDVSAGVDVSCVVAVGVEVSAAVEAFGVGELFGVPQAAKSATIRSNTSPSARDLLVNFIILPSF